MPRQLREGSLTRIESHFDRLSSLVRSRFPSPLENGILGSLAEQRVSTFYLERLYVAIAGNQRFQFHRPSHVHSSGQFRICGNHPVHDFTFAFGLFLLSNRERGRERQHRAEGQYRNCSPAQHYGRF